MIEAKSPLSKIQEIHLLALAAIRNETLGLFERHDDQKTDITQTLKCLFRYMSDRSQAVSFLASYEYEWDAEIVLRSVYETAVKIVFICTADETERISLVEEFWQDLGSIGDRKRARKAKLVENLFRKESPEASQIFEFLGDSRYFNVGQPTRNKASRKKLEEKWSFSGILEKISSSKVQYTEIKALLHIYGTASHLIHADHGAIELMMDRALRKPEELSILQASHLFRILSDQVSLSFWCADVLRLYYDSKFSNSDELKSHLDKCKQIGQPLMDLFYESQKDFYKEKNTHQSAIK